MMEEQTLFTDLLVEQYGRTRPLLQSLNSRQLDDERTVYHMYRVEQSGLGDPSSQVVQRGIVDPLKLHEVLTHRQMTRTYARELIATAMTELFLRKSKDL